MTMQRRSFMQAMFGGVACSRATPFNSTRVVSSENSGVRQDAKPRLAVTFDDPRLDVVSTLTSQDVNRRLLGVLDERSLQTALFVCGRRIDSTEGRALVEDWDSAGHVIGNHSYSHRNYHRTTFANFAADFIRNLPLLEGVRHPANLFRYPFLKAGDTAEKRDRFREVLRQHDHRDGAVTIDASDWYVDQRLRERLQVDSAASPTPYREYYLAHLLDRSAYYRQLALDVLGREIPHTKLVHCNLINALFLPDVFAAFEEAGWEWIDAPVAFTDPVFTRAPNTEPAGESLVWALAKEAGGFDDRLRYPGEDSSYEITRMDAMSL